VPATIQPGVMLAHYRVGSRLGAGGMGEVWLAHDTRLDRDVALKILPADLAANADRMRRFVQEAKAAAALNHPNVAQIYEIGEAGEVHFLAMEYVEGRTLADRIREGPLGPETIVEIAAQTADALELAHSKGITHRDIKPANIMLTPRGQVKVLDFGLAKRAMAVQPESGETATDMGTDPGMVMGTVHYMSPEQARGLEVDPRTDLFSLGVVVYEMATGQRPFAAGTTADTLARILQSEPEPVTQRNPAAPAEMERIVRKCLEKDRDRRYQSARDLAVDLKNLRRDTAPAIASAASAPAVRRLPRRSAMVLFAAAAMVVLLVAAGIWLWLARPGPIDSLAVLPFTNATGNAELEYLSEGITETLINQLSRIAGLRVISRSGVLRYKGKEGEIPKIAGELGVRAVLTGRVTQRGQALAISLELAGAPDSRQLWGERYEGAADQILRIQDRIVQELSARLRLELSAADSKQLARADTGNPEAYRLYLQGLHQLEKFTREGWGRGTEYLNQAIRIDPRYARAHAALAESYFVAGDWFLPSKEAVPKSREAARKAVQLDDSLSEAHCALGKSYVLYFEWADAERELRRAVSLNPNDARSQGWYGSYLGARGRIEESIVALTKAKQLEPVSSLWPIFLGASLYKNRRYESALAELRIALDLDQHWFAYLWLGWTRLAKGESDLAAQAFRKALELSDLTDPRAGLGCAYMRMGKRREALDMLEQLKQRSRTGIAPPDDFAILYGCLGEKQTAVEWAERAYEEHSDMLSLGAISPIFDPIRGEPRFQALMRKLGMPQ